MAVVLVTALRIFLCDFHEKTVSENLRNNMFKKHILQCTKSCAKKYATSLLSVKKAILVSWCSANSCRQIFKFARMPENYLVETPMFVFDRVNFKLPSTILTMAIANNIVILALENHRAIRIDLLQSNAVDGALLFLTLYVWM